MAGGYATIKEHAKRLGCSPEDLLAMARKNDPFYSGSAGQVALAEWFAGWWKRFGFTSGVHLRRMHYALVSTEGAERADGKPYSNTLECWDYLCSAGKHARYLGMVSATSFVDRRNPDPRFHGWQEPYYSKEPFAQVDAPDWKLPEIKTEFEWSLDLPASSVGGYDYGWDDQPYTLMLYVEKSTMDDVLLPLCQEYGVVYITSLGFQSITTVIQVLQHAARCKRPVRMFYISDFDPAGDFMPASVARQVEYWRSSYAGKVEVKLQPIALTAEQVERFGLPPIPVKESDLRRQGFEQRYGVSGATELDALEAIHPGELAGIVSAAFVPYRDLDLDDKLYSTRREALREAEAAWDELVEPYTEQIDELRSDAESVISAYQERLEKLAADFAEEMAPIRDRMEALLERVEEAREQFSPELPARPEAETSATDEGEEGWLFDSERGYMEQLRVYRARKTGESNGHEE